MAPKDEIEEKKERVATHEYLDPQGNVVDDEESASGIRYTLVGLDKPFEWQWDAANETERKMLAVFGAKTLSTNESSGIRNNAKIKGTTEAGVQYQMDAVVERFGLFRADPPQWADRSREGVAVRIDKDALAEAICRVLVEQGKKSQADIDSGHKAKVRQKLEDDPQFVRKSRQVPEVALAYAAIVGKPTATVDDLLNI